MKRRICIFCVSLCLSVAMVCAQEAKSVFVSMPDSLLPALTKVNREDCIDFLASNMKAVVKNRFDQQSEMTRLTADYIAMQLSSQSDYQLKMLPLNDSVRIICTVQTVCGGACDSRLMFYTSDWKPLESGDYLDRWPMMEDFVPDTIPAAAADTLDRSWESLRAEADILLLRASLSDSTTELTLEYTTPEYMQRESSRLFLPFLKRKSLVYEWRGGKFVRKE